MSLATSHAPLERSRTLLGRSKPVKLRRNKNYSSLRLRKNKRRKHDSISDQNTLWRMSNENLMDLSRPAVDKAHLRKSEIQERDTFLDLLCKVQDNRYDNQRYTLKAGSLTDQESNPDDVFDDPPRPLGLGESLDIIPINGSIPCNGTGSLDRNSNAVGTPKMRKAMTVGDLPVVQFQESTDGPRTVGSGSSTGDVDLRRDSLSPPLLMAMGGGTMTPSRRTMEAMKKLISKEGPYPMLMVPPDGGYWIQNGELESARDDDGIWRAPDIDTEHFTIEMDAVANVYRTYFKGQEHANYITRDPKVGPVLLSIKTDQDYQGMLYRAVLRTQKATFYKVMPKSQLPDHMEPEDFIKVLSRISGEELKVENVIRINNSKVEEWIQKFDEHTIDKCHKFGVIYQKKGQTCEEEIFGNIEHPETLDEFLQVLGEKIQLKGFDGYRGGLDVSNNQTGEHSVYTEYKDRKIMFHVSTLLPHDPGDTQHVQKKRHIGNDIVVIIFQDSNTPFCPNMIRSHFIHSYIVVQVEHPHTDHTVYKVAVTAKESVPDFGPPLPDPAVFRKGSEFRDWLLTKALNAEFKCHMAPSFKKLATRTRGQLFLNLIGEIAQVLQDGDLSPSTRSLAMSLQSSGSGPELRSVRNRRRKTLAGIFTRGNSGKDNNTHHQQQQQNSSVLSFPKRKSIAVSPRNFRKSSLLTDGPTSPGRAMMLGSTPDLTMVEDSVPNGRAVHMDVPASPDVDGIQSKRKRRFIFKKSSDKDKKTKRTVSVGGGGGVNVIKRRSKHDNSDDSSLSSALNWSVPYDLPGTVEAEEFDEYYYGLPNSNFAQLKAKWRSNPTIMERNESSDSLSLHDVDISVDIPSTSEVAIQVGDNESVDRFQSPPTSRRFNLRLRHHTSNNKPSPILARSLPSTPQKQNRRQRYVNIPVSGENDSSPEQSMQRSRKVYERKGSKPQITAQLVKISDGDSPEEREHYKNKEIHRARSHDSVSTELDEDYEKLFEALQSVTDDANQLRRDNLALKKENTKLATQNQRLKDKHDDMKHKLTEALKKVNDLELRLKLYHPEFSKGDSL